MTIQPLPVATRIFGPRMDEIPDRRPCSQDWRYQRDYPHQSKWAIAANLTVNELQPASGTTLNSA
ncbi:hypothetical protein ASG92_24915 [Arthrobacter sp. Soil736]|nr:hypothetical protein ASG92_24915 [Arthrobacter sp. Soil736]